ncbi:MAG: ParA family protein [Leptospirales bacterium]
MTISDRSKQRVVVIINQKGGVGKTTTSVNLAAALAQQGVSTLLLDLDPQEDASEHLGVTLDEEATPKGAYSLITEESSLEEVLIRDRLENLDIIPSHVDLAGAELELIRDPISSSTRLVEGLEPSRHDVIVIDCPPSLGLLTINALLAATDVIVPVQTEFFALKGIKSLLNTLSRVRKRNPRVDHFGVLPVMVDGRRSLDNDVIKLIEQEFGNKVYRSRIRKDVRLAEAPSAKKTIFEYAPGTRGARDYMIFSQEVREKWLNEV